MPAEIVASHVAPTAHVDVLIVGAGLSGIGAAVHLQKESPGKSYAILESRAASGGTWDLFRYPGIRSDSDMYTMGYKFKPWENAKAIADGPSILAYIRDTAREHGIDRHIRYGHKVEGAAWSSKDARWTVEIERDGKRETMTCNFLLLCAGYYKYEKGYLPDWPTLGRFKGTLVHPQHWPEGLDHAGKRVLIIGSGATAVTLVPEMAKTAAHVTMLQRSPTYMVSRPAADAMANGLRRYLPAKLAYGITRWKNVLLQMFFYRLARKNPEKTAERLISMVQEQLGPEFDVKTHFTPSYKPWDQRLCLVPDNDMFATIKSGRASVVTDHIEAFTEKGVLLKSGKVLEADIIVTATGLDLEIAGGLKVAVDGRPIEFAKTLIYKGMMYSGVPNLASVFGYTNASWTLKADLIAEYACRLINHMTKTGNDFCVPVNKDPSMPVIPWLDFSSGYVQRVIGRFPRQGARAPWKLHQNYASDMVALRFGSLEDDAMEFHKKGEAFVTEPVREVPLAAE